MKLRVGSKKAFVFIFIAAVILGVMVGIILINNQKAVADKNYIDSQKQKLEVENKVASGKVEDNTNLEQEDKEKEKVEAEDGIKVVPTMLDGIAGNSAYCPTFQIVWNELSDECLDGEDVVFLNDKLTMVDNLNEKAFTKEDISDEYYYIKVGKQVLSVKKEIEDGIKEKFDETSDILDMLDWIDDSKLENTDDITSFVFYTMLKRNFEFNNPFDILDENGLFKDYSGVEYFGIDKESDSKLYDQVDVLFYNDETDFSVKLKTKDNDEVIVARTNDSDFYNFDDVYNYITKQKDEFDGETSFTENDYLKVPSIKFESLKKYDELTNKVFLDKNQEEKVISDAIQTIEFELDNKGGKLKSEAIIALKNAAIMTEPVLDRYFHCTDDFYVFLKEENKEKPYFALRVEDLKDFQEDVKLLNEN